jgi:hypothetical protein
MAELAAHWRGVASILGLTPQQKADAAVLNELMQVRVW